MILRTLQRETRIGSFLLCLIAFSTLAEAQDNWRELPIAKQGKIDFLQKIDCWADYCSAIDVERDSVNYLSKVVVLHSNDAGLTWIRQDPGLPSFFQSFAYRFYKVQQIDSLSFVAVSDTGLIVHTFNGGQSWELQHCPQRSCNLRDVSFSDSLHGIIAGGSSTTSGIFTTTDGGRNWVQVPFAGTLYSWYCHAYSDRSFRVAEYGNGRIYYTRDNWQTVDSSESPFAQSSSDYVITGYYFSGDTIIGYGSHWQGSVAYALLIRTIDGGVHWDSPITFDSILTNVTAFAHTYGDTLIAGSALTNGKYLISTDFGETWSIDSFHFSSHTPSKVVLDFAASRSGIIGLFADDLFSNGSIVARTEEPSSNVRIIDGAMGALSFFPNPCMSSLTISKPFSEGKVDIFDVLGREVLSTQLHTHETTCINVSEIPVGVYSVFLKNQSMLAKGSLVIVR